MSDADHSYQLNINNTSQELKMNNLSLSQKYKQIQHDSSWIDDVFKFVTYETKEMNSMGHQRNLEYFIQEIISKYGIHCYDHYELYLDNLPSYEQEELVRLYIESIDREIECAFYGEDQSINSDFLCAMLAMLQDSNHKTQANFAQVTTRNILAYYKTTLQYLLDKGCELYFTNEMHAAGYRAEYDQEHGDVVWGKF
jgi:hypothetical protein